MLARHCLVLALAIAVAGCDCGGDDDDQALADGGGDDRDAQGEVDGAPDLDGGDGLDATADGGSPPSERACLVPPWSEGDPQLPAIGLDLPIDEPAIVGRRIDVAAGGDLQAALDEAQPGDEIVLEAGAVFSGNYTLQLKGGEGWIVVRGSRMDELPAQGTRVGPDQEALMPVIETPSSLPALETADRAHHYWLAGIAFRPAGGQDPNDLVIFGSGTATDVADLAHHLVIDRCIVRGDPVVGGKRGVQLNSGATGVYDSWFEDWKRVGQDTQALLGWNGPGPFRIWNNFLEGAGENVMFGGADARIPDLIPTDIEICGNLISKPLEWKEDDPSYAGMHWSVKNLFELKVGRRVLFSGNQLERVWTDAQTGFAIVIKSANQDGSQPWAVTEHVTVAYNAIRDANNGLSISRTDGGSLGTNHVRVYSNVVHPVGGDEWGGGGRLFQVLDGVTALTIDRNTGFGRSQVVIFDGQPND